MTARSFSRSSRRGYTLVELLVVLVVVPAAIAFTFLSLPWLIMLFLGNSGWPVGFWVVWRATVLAGLVMASPTLVARLVMKKLGKSPASNDKSDES